MNRNGSAPLAIVAGFILLIASPMEATIRWSAFPPKAQSQISARLGRNGADYKARPHGKGFRFCDSTGRQWSADFNSAGMKVASQSSAWKMSLRTYGYGTALKTFSRSSPTAERNRIEYRRGSVTEWYVNGPAGLEQGFTFDRPIAEGGNRPLTISLALTGKLRPLLNENRDEVSLVDSRGEVHWRYSGLLAYDSDGKELKSSLHLLGSDLLIQIDDRDAHYPIVVDPWIQTAELASSDGAANDEFGWSAGISGNTIVVGAPFHTVGSHTQQGAAYVFVMPDGGWGNMNETAELMASDGSANDYFGSSVAVSGGTIVVGADGATINGNPHQGAAYVFVEPNGGWKDTTETAKIAASDGYVGDDFGASAAISGNTIAVGAPYAYINGNSEQGAAYVFVQPQGGWTNMTQTAKVTASDGAANDILGNAIAIDGQTVVVGASGANVAGAQSAGAAYVFVQPQGGWTNMTETGKLTASDSMPSDFFGASVSISGNTIAVGAPSDFTGAAYVFVQPQSGWANMTQTAELGASGFSSQLLLGTSVATNGSAVVAGAVGAAAGKNPYQGVLFIFVESRAGWTNEYQYAQQSSSDGAAGDYFGHALALDGTNGVATAPFHQVGSDVAQGTAYVFQTLNKHPQAGSLTPDNAIAGGSAFQLTVQGQHFVSGAVVNWNGSPRQTTFVSGATLRANILASDIAQAGKYKVTVTDPPPGGGTSNSLTFTVNNPTPQLTQLKPNQAKKGGPSFTMRILGSGFVPGAVAKDNGEALDTTFVNSGEIDATIPASALKNAGTYKIIAVNPGPGGGKSNALTFTVTK